MSPPNALWPGLSRLLAALVGGYALASAATWWGAVILPMDRAEAVLFGMMLGLLLFAGAGLWAFTVRRALWAWLGIVGPAALLAGMTWFVRQGGAG